MFLLPNSFLVGVKHNGYSQHVKIKDVFCFLLCYSETNMPPYCMTVNKEIVDLYVVNQYSRALGYND